MELSTVELLSLSIVLFLAFGMGVALWQERKYGRKDDSPEE